MSASLNIAGLYFTGTGASGYSLTATSPFTYTLTGNSTTIGTEISNATAVAIGAENTSGTNTVSAPIALVPASGTVSTIFQQTGGTLELSGGLTGTGSLSKTGGGNLTLSGATNSLAGVSVAAGTMTVASGAQLAITGAGILALTSPASMTVSGTLLYQSSHSWAAADIPTGTLLTIASGGTYIHNTTAGVANLLANTRFVLATGSNFIYRGSSTLTPATSFSGRTYYNLSFESTSGSWTATASGASALTINGDLTVGSGVTFALGAFTGANNFNGNITISGAMTGAGSFTIGSAKQLLINNGGSVTLPSTQTVTIASNGTAQILGTGSISGAGNFTLSSGSTFITSNATGLDGAVVMTGTETFNTGANYEFQGAATGTTLPSTVNNLTINRTSGNVDLNGAGTTQTVSNTLNIYSGSLNANGTRTTINVGGTSDALVMRGGGQINNNATVNLTGASGGNVVFDAVNNGTATIASNLGLGGQTRTFNIGNGSAATDMLVSGTISNGAITKSGLGTLELSGPNTYSGGTTVSAGTLLASATSGNSSTGSGAVLVNGSGTLSGTGFVNSGGNTITINGTLSPGSGPAAGNIGTINLASSAGAGALTLGSTSNLMFDITNTSTKDLIALSNTGVSLGGGTLTLNLGGGFDYTQQYAIFTGVSGLTGSFGTVTGYDSVNYAPVFTLNGSEYDLTFTAVPEPSTWIGAALALGAMVFTLRRRKARRA